MLQHLINSIFTDGAFAVIGPDGKAYLANCSNEADAPVVVRIHDDKTLRKIASKPTLAVGEAYMDGTLTIERGTLYDFLALATRNSGHMARQFGIFGRRRPKNSHKKARRNVAHHYDLSGELYRLFLDADRQYSCAYYPDPSLSLEEAQAAKKNHLAAKLLLKPGQRVLDIGSGWGGLGLSLAEEFGAEVLGVTLSTEQLDEARARAMRHGLDRRVRFELRDFRDVVGKFDRVVSVGMFEHIGPAHYQAYFNAIARLLDEGGVAVVHTIGRADGPGGGNPWIEKYIFPGGTLPALSEIMTAVEESGLILTDVEVLRLHYAETLKAWRERFAANRDKVRALYDERFCRMWEFYLAGSEAGFREGALVVFQLQLAKDKVSVPQTRDYITDFDRAHRSGARIAAD